MKAIVQEGSGSADALHVREIPKPTIAADRVLVRVRAASVNAADWHTVHGGVVVRAIAAAMRSPILPVRGLDLAGEVEAVGEAVTRLRPGDAVFGAGSGTFAEYAAVPEDRLAPKPARLSFEEAAALPVAGLTALQGLRDRGQLRPGKRVLVYGAGGGVGTFAVQIAKALGARVTAVTGTRNLDIVRSLGPDDLIDYTQEDVARRGERYDLILDVAATRPLAELARLLAPDGRLVLAGAAKAGMLAVLGRMAGARLRSRFLGQHIPPLLARVTRDDLLALAELVESGKLRPAIDRAYPLSEAAEAVRYVGTGQARAKVVVTVA